MNTTVNGSSCSNLLNPTAAKIGSTFAYCLIIVVSLVGNSFIGIIVYKTPTLRKPINYLIANMAISDLLFPIFQLPLRITELYVDSWLIGGHLGQALCKLLPFVAHISVIVSIQSLVLIAVDRFGAVIFPLRSPLITPKRCPFFILATWIAAMAIFWPYLFVHKLVEYPGKMACEATIWNEGFGESSSVANYFLAGFIVFFYIPVVLLVILYSIILIKLKTRAHPGEHSANAEEQRTRRNKNVLKMAIAIVSGFVFCWVPSSILLLLHWFAWDGSISCGIIPYLVFAWFMAHANCAINPIICFIFSSNYRQGLKRLLNCFTAVQE